MSIKKTGVIQIFRSHDRFNMIMETSHWFHLYRDQTKNIFSLSPQVIRGHTAGAPSVFHLCPPQCAAAQCCRRVQLPHSHCKIWTQTLDSNLFDDYGPRLCLKLPEVGSLQKFACPSFVIHQWPGNLSVIFSSWTYLSVYLFEIESSCMMQCTFMWWKMSSQMNIPSRQKL